MNDIMVSICCLAYNHKNYIRKALDSFLMQKTNFKFEILINDDCSTDGTTEIIKEYEAKYPDIIKPLYQQENQYSKSFKGHMMSFNFNFPRVSGKYVAMCEGDDFWVDDTKLQKQFDALENHPECSFSTHTVRCTTESGKPTKELIPAKDTMKVGVISSEDAIRGVCRLPYAFHTSSYFFRAEYLDEILHHRPDFLEFSPMTDVVLMLFFAAKGCYYRFEETMSCYRRDSVSSVVILVDNAKKENGKNLKKIKYYEEHLKAIIAYNEYTNFRYNDDVYYCQLKNEYHLMIMKQDYRHLFKKRYKEVAPLFLSKSSKKAKFKLRILSLFPFLINLKHK